MQLPDQWPPQPIKLMTTTKRTTIYQLPCLSMNEKTKHKKQNKEKKKENEKKDRKGDDKKKEKSGDKKK